ANIYGRIPSSSLTIDLEHLNLALDAIESYHDYNEQRQQESIPAMTFWSQYYNETSQTWISIPSNMVQLFNQFDHNLSEIIKLLELIGIKGIAKLISVIEQQSDILSKILRIPSDFDDTYVHIGLGSLLKLSEKQYSLVPYEKWLKSNSNFKQLIQLTLKYSYRPTHVDQDYNTIDPRTYYWLREFLYD
ncbi:unnamed protein product, partial [Didymodactylos carnosus]